MHHRWRSSFLAVGIVAMLQLLSAGCMGTARVRTGEPTTPNDKTGLPGVPFYPKSAACKQETVWLEPIYVLTREDTYATTEPTKPKKLKQVKAARRSDLASMKPITSLDRLSTIQSELAAAHEQINAQSLAKINLAWNNIISTAVAAATTPTDDDLVLAGDDVAPVVYVDYSRPYYFNTRMPWIGSSTANATISGDGSLSQATSTSDVQTANALLTALPVTALASRQLGLTPPTAVAAATPDFEPLILASVMDSTFPGDLQRILQQNQGVSDSPVEQPLPQLVKMLPILITLDVDTTYIRHTLAFTTAPATNPCIFGSANAPLKLSDRTAKHYHYKLEALPSPAKAPEKKTDDAKPPTEK